MSKIGKQPVLIPAQVEVQLENGRVQIKGPKGVIEKSFPRVVDIKKTDSELLVSVKRKDKSARALHGTVRSLIGNMVKGVTDGWSKKLELVGTGYRAEVNGKDLVLTVGYINPVRITPPEGILFKVEKSEITVEGIDKEVVGELAARIRGTRPPEPYQGKGVRYKDEEIKKKPGKAAKAVEA